MSHMLGQSASAAPLIGPLTILTWMDEDVELLKAVGRQRLHAVAALPIVSTRCQHLWDTLGTAYRALGSMPGTG